MLLQPRNHFFNQNEILYLHFNVTTILFMFITLRFNSNLFILSNLMEINVLNPLNTTLLL